MTQPLVKKTADYVQKKLCNDPTGHDWHHVERVWKIAKQLQKEEGGDLEIIELAALLHDLGDYKQHQFDEVKGLLVLRGMMDVLEIEEACQEKIMKIVEEAQYAGDSTVPPSTLEGKIVRDANWLDVLGAVGIARVFAIGGSIGRAIYDPERKPRKKLTRLDYQRKKKEGTSLNYFYEKVLKLPDMMYTKTAKKLAAGRAQFVEKFIEQFLAEWGGKK
ncbi:MAG: HD domain-containing protein [bacterium]|nr:HD domain-containing protein [bacterium]